VDEIRQYSREMLLDYRPPRHVELLDSLPKSAMDKVLRPELVAEEGADPEGSGVGSVEDTG
jgi:acyl-coenzyme A synthetase/AMP-(fatty) acid ligase